MAQRADAANTKNWKDKDIYVIRDLFLTAIPIILIVFGFGTAAINGYVSIILLSVAIIWSILVICFVKIRKRKKRHLKN